VPGVVVETHVVRLDGRVQLAGAQLVSTFSNLFSSFRHFGQFKISWSVCFAFRGECVCWCSMSPIFYAQLFRTKVFCAAFMCATMWVCNFLAKGFWHKRCSQNVGEIDTWCLLISLEEHRKVLHLIRVQGAYSQLSIFCKLRMGLII